jgi:hypothetical protein
MDKICTYCDNLADTVDHIPPRALIRSNGDFELLKVPSCSKCNREFSVVDEIARDFIASELRNERHPLVMEVIGPARSRAWKRSPGKAARMAAVSVVVPVGGGHYAPAYDMECPEMRTFMRRMMIALAYTEFGVRIPANYVGWDTAESWAHERMGDPTGYYRNGKLRTLGGEIFQYQGDYSSRTQRTFWWMRFFGGMELYVWWGPNYNVN